MLGDVNTRAGGERRPMPTTERALRADARRNRARIMAAAGELFARDGRDAQIDEIAAHSGVGIGTLYRHVPIKQALLTAMVQERFAGMAELAHFADTIDDPLEAFETVLRSYLEAADGDAAFQLALMGSSDIGIDWADLGQEKSEFAATLARIIDRAVAAGVVRNDLSLSDVPMLVGGVMATMHFAPGGNTDWRRHLELTLAGIRLNTPPSR